MSSLLILNLDCLSSPSVKFQSQAPSSSQTDVGCGFGWYPNDDAGAAVIKDYQASRSQQFVNAVTDWSHFRSTTFFCYLTGAAKNFSQRDTQPFYRSFANHDWLFMHQGELNKSQLKTIIPVNDFIQPIGTTDSELIFCYLLSMLHQQGIQHLAEINPSQLLLWCEALNPFGTANIALTDGDSTFIYHGQQPDAPIFHTRISPPNTLSVLEANDVSIYFDDPRDVYRTMMIFSSMPFHQGDWYELQPGQLVIVNHGSVVWSNHPIGGEKTNVRAHEQIQALQAIPSLSSQQISQAQGIVAPLSIKSMTQTAEGQPLTYRLYDILHTTHYAYENPIEYSTHTFRLTPVEDRIQEIVAGRIEISIHGELLTFEDVFDNQSIYYTIDKPYQELIITCTSQVKVYACPENDFSSSMRRSTIPLVWMPWQRQMMLPYLLPQELPESQLIELTNYAMSFVKRNNYNLLATLSDLNQHIYQEYHYMPGTTSLHTTPFEVFASRKGVCQDFANLFICLARLLSIPARYRVGYIYTGNQYNNTLQSDASHAWAEVYLPYIGWQGFDPTNGTIVAQDHVRVACGRNYRDATPTSGTLYKGNGKETITINVQINLHSNQ